MHTFKSILASACALAVAACSQSPPPEAVVDLAQLVSAPQPSDGQNVERLLEGQKSSVEKDVDKFVADVKAVDVPTLLAARYGFDLASRPSSCSHKGKGSKPKNKPKDCFRMIELRDVKIVGEPEVNIVYPKPDETKTVFKTKVERIINCASQPYPIDREFVYKIDESVTVHNSRIVNRMDSLSAKVTIPSSLASATIQATSRIEVTTKDEKTLLSEKSNTLIEKFSYTVPPNTILEFGISDQKTQSNTMIHADMVVAGVFWDVLYDGASGEKMFAKPLYAITRDPDVSKRTITVRFLVHTNSSDETLVRTVHAYPCGATKVAER